MNQTCDRCGPAVRAAYRMHRDGELYLCRHCATRLRAALSAQGWAIRPIGQHVLVPQPG
jgi:predicted nucleic acid-binding Zn ribbon protein